MRLLSMPRIGLLCAVVYAINAVHYGWRPSSRDAVDDLIAWLTATVLIALYYAGYKSLLGTSRPHLLHDVVIPALPLILIAFLTVPYDSTDVFLYMDVGWAQSHYRINPYTTVLRDIPGIADDPMLRMEWMKANKNAWMDLPLVYGFLFGLVTAGIAWMGQGNWWLTLALFKLVNIAAYGVTAGLILMLSLRLHHQRPDGILYMFMWSPLILLHHIANAHNDLLVGCLVVLALYLVLHKSTIWAPAVLAAGALIKYASLPLIPVFLYYILKKEGPLRALIAGLIAGAVSVCLSLPYIWDIANFRFDLIEAQLNKITAGSLYAFLFYIYRFVTRFVAPLGSLETFGAATKIVLWILSAIAIIRGAYAFSRKSPPDTEDLISLCSCILFVIILVGSSQFYSWYLGMMFPLVLTLKEGTWLRQFSILLSAAHVLSLTSLSRKGIGYFLLTTGNAVTASYFQRK